MKPAVRSSKLKVQSLKPLRRSGGRGPWFWLLLLSFELGALSFAALAAPIRVAVMDFTVEELSYRSSKAAVDLTGVLQAELAVNPPAGIEFVERAELDRAVTELQLGGIGLADRRDGLRAGHWARADWAVFGTLVTNHVPGGPRQLRLEAVELARASVLSATNLSVKSLASTHFSPDAGEFSRLANELGGWLAGEADRESTLRTAMVVAALPLSGRPEGTLDWFDHSVPASLPLRLLSLDAATQATAEADFALAGFTASSTNLPALAEFFVWPERPPAKAAGRFVIWDGRGPLLSVQLTNGLSTNGNLGGLLMAIRQERAGKGVQPQLREQLAARLAAEAGMATSSAAFHLRQWELAVWLAPTNPVIWEGWLRFRWESFELAPSYDKFPRGEFNHERHRFEAWADYLDRFGNLSGSLASASWARTPAREFTRAVIAARDMTLDGSAKSQAGIPDDVGGVVLAEWRRRFVSGLVARLPTVLAQEDVRTNAATLLEPILTDMERGADSREARSRVAAFEQLWVLARRHQREHLGQWADRPHVLEEFFEAAGQISMAARYVAETKAIWNEGQAAVHARTERLATNTVVALPRIHLLDEAGREQFWTLEGVGFRPPILPHTAQRIEFATNANVASVNAVVRAGGKLWLWAERAEAADADAEAKPNRGTQPGGFSLWTVTLTNPVPQLAQVPFAVNSVTGVAADGDELWLTRTDGLTVWNVVSGSVRHLGTNDGLPSERIWRVAVQGARAMAVGRELVWSTNSGANWQQVRLALPRSSSRANPSELPSYASWPIGVSGNSWVVGDAGRALYAAQFGEEPRTNAQFMISRRGAWSIPTRFASATDGGFWIAAQQGIHRASSRLEPLKEIHAALMLPGYARFSSSFYSELPRRVTNATDVHVTLGLVRSLAMRAQSAGQLMLARLTGPIRAMVAAGDFLWVASSSYGREVVACYDTGRRGWVAAISLPREVLWLEPIGDTLGAFWSPVEGDRSAGVLLKLTAAGELAARSVMPDLIPEAELVARTAGLTPVQQAVAALFTGHPDQVVKLLQDSEPEARGPEALALLALACDPSGLDRPAESGRWAELGRREFPASVFTRAVWLDRCQRAARERLAARKVGESTPSALLRDYDASGDGALDLLELNLGLDCEPYRFRSQPGSLQSPQQLPALLARFDRDQRPGLSADELALALAKPKAATNVPTAPAKPPPSSRLP